MQVSNTNYLYYAVPVKSSMYYSVAVNCSFQYGLPSIFTEIMSKTKQNEPEIEQSL